MDQIINVLLAIDKAHTALQRALDGRPCLGGLNQVYGPNHPTPSAWSFCGKYNTLFIYTIISKAIWHHTDGVAARRTVDKKPENTCTNKNLLDIKNIFTFLTK